MHYFQLHIGDYDRDTAALSLMEHGAYGKLMRSYYATERPLPNEPESLWRICGAMTRAEKMAVGLVAERFFRMTADGLRHKRMDAEIADYHAQLETASRAGKASATARQRKANARSTPVDIPLQRKANAPPNGTSTNHEPVTNNHTERDSQRVRPTVEQAKARAGNIGVSEQEAEDWWNAREASDWMKGTGGGGTTPVGNWQADCKTYTNAMRDQKARDAKRGGTNGTTPNGKPPTETVWQITQSIEAINDEIREIDASVPGAWGELSPAKKEKRRALVDRRRELKAKLTGLEERA